MVRTAFLETEFFKLLRECVEEGLRNVLGRMGANVFLYNLDFSNSIDDPKEFHKNLYNIFGKVALILEIEIIKELYGRLRIPYAIEEPFSYEECINLLKKTLAAPLMKGVSR